MTSPQVSIIIVNYNGRERLEACLSSLFRLAFPSAQREILVVDNASTDDSVSWLRRRYGKKVRCLPLDENKGFGAAVNDAAKSARGQYLALLNPDAKVHPDWLSFLVQKIQMSSKIAAVNGKTYLLASQREKTPRIQNAGSIVFQSGFGRDRGAMVEGNTQSYEPDSPYFDQPTQLLAFCGVAVLLRKDIFLQCGGFDNQMFLYYEDTDLSLRLLRSGWQIWYEPNAVIWHQHAASSGENSPFFLYHVEKNRLRLVWKHLPWTRVWQETTWYFLVALGSLLRAGRTYAQSPSRFSLDSPLAFSRLRISVELVLSLPEILLARWKVMQTGSVSFTQALYDELY